MKCVMCQIVKEEMTPPGGVIYRDDDFIVCHSLDVGILGYLLVFPVRHVEGYDAFSPKELEKLALLKQRLVQFLKQSFSDVEKVYICSFSEATPHIHFHVFPRYEWMLASLHAYTDGQIDAVKIFSELRKQFSTTREENIAAQVCQLTEQFQLFLSANPL